MNFCQTHWDKLRAEIHKQGLDVFVARNGNEAAGHAKRQVEGEDTVIDFEPLMGASMNIFRLAIHIIGNHLIVADESGKPPCPVCALETMDWIQEAVRGQLQQAQVRDLMAASHEE